MSDRILMHLIKETILKESRYELWDPRRGSRTPMKRSAIEMLKWRPNLIFVFDRSGDAYAGEPGCYAEWKYSAIAPAGWNKFDSDVIIPDLRSSVTDDSSDEDIVHAVIAELEACHLRHDIIKQIVALLRRERGPIKISSENMISAHGSQRWRSSDAEAAERAIKSSRLTLKMLKVSATPGQDRTKEIVISLR